MTFRHWQIFPLLLCVVSQPGCLELGDEGDHLGATLNKTAVEMVANHELQRTRSTVPGVGRFNATPFDSANTIHVGTNLAMHPLGNIRAVYK